MEGQYCGNCRFSRPFHTKNELLAECIYCIHEGPRYPDLYACDKWASRCVDDAQLKPSSKHYIFCNIDNKTGEGRLVVKLDFKFKTKTMLPDAIYSMTLQELLDMEDKKYE